MHQLGAGRELRLRPRPRQQVITTHPGGPWQRPGELVTLVWHRPIRPGLAKQLLQERPSRGSRHHAAAAGLRQSAPSQDDRGPRTGDMGTVTSPSLPSRPSAFTTMPGRTIFDAAGPSQSSAGEKPGRPGSVHPARDAVPGSVVVHTDDVAWQHSRFGWADLLNEGILNSCACGAAGDVPAAGVGRASARGRDLGTGGPHGAHHRRCRRRTARKRPPHRRCDLGPV